MSQGGIFFLFSTCKRQDNAKKCFSCSPLKYWGGVGGGFQSPKAFPNVFLYPIHIAVTYSICFFPHLAPHEVGGQRVSAGGADPNHHAFDLRQGTWIHSEVLVATVLEIRGGGGGVALLYQIKCNPLS